MEQISLNKQVFSKTQYEKVIDTSFNQLVQTTSALSSSLFIVSIPEFFQNYQELFFQIPKFGDINSHEYLIKTSQTYIGTTPIDNETITALIDEITQLRQDNLELQQLISISGSI